MTTQQLETLLGRRDSIRINTTVGISRKSARAWLKAQGVSTLVVNGMTIAQLQDAVNDTSDGKLGEAKAALTASGGAYTFASTPSAQPASGGLGTMDAMISGMIDSKLAGHKPGMDAAEIRDIVDSVLAGAQLDVNPASVDTAINTKLSTVRGDMQSQLNSALMPLQPVLDAIKLDGAVNTNARTPVIAAMAAGNEIMQQLAPYYKAGTDCGVNVMLCSPPSFGKSHTIRELGQTYDAYFEHGCSSDMDEIATQLGGPLPDGKGGFAIVDGVLAQAARAALSGKNVLLLLDEVLRLPDVVQSWLLTILAPRWVDGQRVYSIRTRRFDGGKLEVLNVPAKHLHIVSATNLTMCIPVQAFWSRWEKIRIEFTNSGATSTAQAILNAKGIKAESDGTTRLAAKFAEIVGASRQSVKAGTTQMPVDFRMLERAAMTAPDATESATASRLADRLSDNVAHWDGDLGDTDAESRKLATEWANKLRSI